MARWSDELYLPNPVIDRDNRENWSKAGEPRLRKRTRAEVERRLAAYEPVATGERLERELQRLIRAGMAGDRPLPEVPAHEPQAPAETGRRRRRTRRGG
jgi:trimethylamine:corrinoid methyltransferase-like protein